MDISNFSKTTSQLDQVQLAVFSNACSDRMPRTHLMDNTLKLLDDNSEYGRVLANSTKLSLARMLIGYTQYCWPVYTESLKLDTLLNSGTSVIYHIQGTEGYRVATQNEVSNGVIGLIGEEMVLVPKEDMEYLTLLDWTFSGRYGRLSKLGYNLAYNQDGTPTESYFDTIRKVSQQLKGLIGYMQDSERFDLCIKVLKKKKRTKSYQYPAYATDEVRTNISMKQVMFKLKQIIPKGSSDPNIRKAWTHIIKQSENKWHVIDTADKSMLRSLLIDLESHPEKCRASKEGTTGTSLQDHEIMSLCSQIDKGVKQGLLSPEHFALKVIRTLKSRQYIGCSPKQMQILEDAIQKIQVKGGAVAVGVENGGTSRPSKETWRPTLTTGSNIVTIPDSEPETTETPKNLGTKDGPKSGLLGIEDIASLLGGGQFGDT